jgi:periplasmic protein TonB
MLTLLPSRPPRPSRRVWRGIGTAALASIAIHAIVVTAVLGFMRHGAPLRERPDKPAEVELVMVEKKGAGETTTSQTSPQPTQAAPSQPEDAQTPQPEDAQTPQPENAQTPQPEEHATVPGPELPMPPPAEPRPPPPEPVPPPQQQPPPRPEPPRPEAEKPQEKPPPQATSALTMNLSGTDSDSNAEVVGGKNVIPAKPDKKSRNRPPLYPFEAAQRGDHGNVILLIHVSPDGFAAGVDVMKSSGHPVLDQAARDAVSKWRFIPAVKDGVPIPFDTAMAFDFRLN